MKIWRRILNFSGEALDTKLRNNCIGRLLGLGMFRMWVGGLHLTSWQRREARSEGGSNEQKLRDQQVANQRFIPLQILMKAWLGKR